MECGLGKEEMRERTFGGEWAAVFRPYGVVLAYLFGSQAKGTAGPLSDVDIAVLLGPEVPLQEYTYRQAHLIADLVDLLNCNEVDVVVLNWASPLLKHNVLRYGQVLYDTGVRLAFEIEAQREALFSALGLKEGNQ
ncbi:MAG TPA: nucleotidyltransferase domain-containing protein [Armatimonadetes bacterium]|nr:nucleotidyltransferase domain-containing protein [Armatimonadota bacterium]